MYRLFNRRYTNKNKNKTKNIKNQFHKINISRKKDPVHRNIK
jgi:hypothetical protein